MYCFEFKCYSIYILTVRHHRRRALGHGSRECGGAASPRRNEGATQEHGTRKYAMRSGVRIDRSGGERGSGWAAGVRQAAGVRLQRAGSRQLVALPSFGDDARTMGTELLGDYVEALGPQICVTWCPALNITSRHDFPTGYQFTELFEGRKPRFTQ